MDAPRQAPSTPPRAGLAWVGIAVLALAAGWSAGRLTRPADNPAPQGPAAAPQARMQAAAPARQITPPAPARPHAVTAARMPAAIGTAEVCGFGRVQLPPDEPDPLQRIPPALRQSALEAMDAAMLASDDPRVRAAGLWMGARLRGREIQARVEQMARLAMASSDPYVYAMALDACQGLRHTEGSHCALLSRAQWVRLDPDNAVPWEALAAEAREHGEPWAESAALQLAARAARSDLHTGWLPRLVEQALGAQTAPLQRTLALTAGWSAEAVWAASHGQPAAAHGQGYDLSCDNVEHVQRRMAKRAEQRTRTQELAGLK